MYLHDGMSHDGSVDDARMRDFDTASKHDDVNDDESDRQHHFYPEHDHHQQQHQSATFYNDGPLHRQMTVGTPDMDHVAFADTVLNSPSMASIVIHADNDVMDKHRRRHNEIDLVTRIKGV